MSNLTDPTEPQVTDYLQMILLMVTRIYDVQVAILNAMDPMAANNLTDIHEQMKFAMPVPFVNVEE